MHSATKTCFICSARVQRASSVLFRRLSIRTCAACAIEVRGVLPQIRNFATKAVVLNRLREQHAARQQQ